MSTIKEEIEKIAKGRKVTYLPCEVKWMKKIASGYIWR